MGSASPLCMFLILLTALVSLAGFSTPQLIRSFAISPYLVLRDGRWYQMLTSGFLHGSLGHLFVNMFTLFFFGRAMETTLGSAGFLILYFGSMFCGSLGTLLFHGRDPSYRAIGASGAVSGIVFGYVLFQPFAKIYLLLFPVGIPAFLFAIGYVAVSIFGARTRLGRIGHAAHLGGALGGIILTSLIDTRALPIFLSHFR